jgi:Ca2+-binding RTX toxin-like protein
MKSGMKMATFTGTSGADNFTGTAAADDFYFDTANLTNGDHIKGGGSIPLDPIDRLFLSGTGQLIFDTLDPFHIQISNIEQIYLSTLGSNLVFLPVFVNSASNGKTEVFGQGIGVDYITLSSDYYYGTVLTGKLIVRGGDGNDQLSANIYSNNYYVEFHGDAGDDTISGNGWLDGGTGNDKIYAGYYAYVTAGTGDDSINLFGANVKIYGGDGVDTVAATQLYDNVTFDSVEFLRVSYLSCTPTQLNNLPSSMQWQFVYPGADFNFYLTGGGACNLSTIATGISNLIINIVDPFYGYTNSITFAYSITGGAGINTLYGGYGNDSFIGGISGDKLFGGVGNDILDGKDGNDLLNGGEGSDAAYGGAGEDSIYILGSTGVQEWAYGGDGNDTFNLTSRVGFKDYLYGGSIAYQTGTIDGGTGYDTINLYDLSDISNFNVNGVEAIYAQYTLYASASQLANFQSINLGNGAINITGSGIVDMTGKLVGTGPIKVSTLGGVDLTIYGTTGDDQFDSGKGNDTFYGGAGNDLFNLNVYSLAAPLGVNQAYGGTGNDTFYDAYEIYAPRYIDSMFGGDGDDTFYAQGGTIDGGAGNDVIIINNNFDATHTTNVETIRFDRTTGYFATLKIAKTQLDQIQHFDLKAGAAALIISGDGAIDLTAKFSTFGVNISFTDQTTGANLTATAFDDNITGGSFSDSLFGGFGNDAISGDLGNDYVYGGSDSDILQGNAGNDALFGGDGGDTLQGDIGNDYLYGGAGNDYITSLAANGAAFGNLGNDVIFGGDGDDTIDTPSLTNSYGVYSYSTYYIEGGEGTDAIHSVSANGALFGGNGNDLIDSFGTGNYIYGGVGDDQIQAGGGHDVAFGGLGNDLLYSNSSNTVYLLGEEGNDTIAGGDGADYIDGGAGVDGLFGGWGNDYFVGGSDSDYFILNYDVSVGDVDIISDFTAAEDHIGLTAAMTGHTYVLDTAYGIDIVYYIDTGIYQVFLTNTHSVSQVTAAIYYDGV